MTPIATTFLIIAITLVWGGLVASVLYLRRRPELVQYPPGAPDDHRQEAGPVERDT